MLNQLPCLVCSETLSVRIATGRKSGKAFLMLVCPKDGRHIRAFVSDREFVAGVIESASSRGLVETTEQAARLGQETTRKEPATGLRDQDEC